MARNKNNRRDDGFDERVIEIKRVSKKTKGGNRISFTALMVVGDNRGKVGIALGKAPDVVSAIKKASRIAKNKLIQVPLKGSTIPFQVTKEHKAAKIFLKPAPPGTGVIAGGPVRAVVEATGISDIVGKIQGSDNPSNNVKATFQALDQIRKIVRIKQIEFDKPKPKKSEDKESKKSTKQSKSKKTKKSKKSDNSKKSKSKQTKKSSESGTKKSTSNKSKSTKTKKDAKPKSKKGSTAKSKKSDKAKKETKSK